MEVVAGGSHVHSRKWWSPATRRCSRWCALHLHACSRSYGSCAGNLRDPIFDDRFLKALATWEAERVPCLLPVTRITAHSTLYCSTVTAPSSPAVPFLPTWGSLMATPIFYSYRHGVSINTELACRFPSATRAEQSFAGRSPPAPHPQSPGVEPRLL